MSLPNELNFIADKLNIYSGAILFIIGSIGALLNIFAFSQPSLRISPCSICLLAGSVFDLCHLINTLFTRILATFAIVTYAQSNGFCRLRSFIAEVASLCAASCLCLAAFDRCMSTSRKQYQRQWSSHTFVRRSLLITLIIWSLVNIPQLVYKGVVNNTCAILSIDFSLYLNYIHTPLFYGLFPIIPLAYLGNRTIKNIREIQHAVAARRRLERQLNRMLLLQISVTLLTSILLMIQAIYTAVTMSTSKDTTRIAIESLCLQIVRLLFYLNYTSSFYFNYCVSPEVRFIISRLFTCQQHGRRIEPLATIIQTRHK